MAFTLHIKLEEDVDPSNPMTFARRDDAEKYYAAAVLAIGDRRLIRRRRGDQVLVLRVEMFETKAYDARQTKAEVESGRANLIKEFSMDLELELDLGDLPPPRQTPESEGWE